jgi:hypothetical protein
MDMKILAQQKEELRPVFLDHVYMNNMLILFAHPRYKKSRANRRLLGEIKKLEGVSFHDLCEEYADFNIDVERERMFSRCLPPAAAGPAIHRAIMVPQ